MKDCTLLLLFTWICLQPAFAQNNGHINERLGRGINMGNAFEAPTETEWGNPWQPEYFQIIAELGFQHVRVPIRWETPARSMEEAPFTIEPSFFARIQEVVDEALQNKLHVIINMHHHDTLYEHPEEEKARFLSQWSQIAEHFKDYPDSLLFEVLNEPHGNLTPEKWNVFFADALAEIRSTNPERYVLMGTAEYGGLSGVKYLELPDDDRLVLSVHYYNPFNFTHQGAEWVGPQSQEWLGTKWNDTEAERNTVINEFGEVLAFAETHQIPLHVGEFGAYSTADIESRARWTTFLGRWFEAQNLSWAYWEFSAGFGIYNPATAAYIEPLIDALLHNSLPEPAETNSVVIYESNFEDGTDGWALVNQGGASASLSRLDNSLDVTIANGGSEGWHVQLSKSNIPLKKGRLYQVSFKMSATAARGATFYAGKNSSPWNAYSGYAGISVMPQDKVFYTSFNMTEPTDEQARLVFDLGESDEGVRISDIVVEEINLLTSADISPFHNILVYPNPVTDRLCLKNLPDGAELTIYDLHGKVIGAAKAGPTENSLFVDMSGYTKGVYILRLMTSYPLPAFKLLKE